MPAPATTRRASDKKVHRADVTDIGLFAPVVESLDAHEGTRTVPPGCIAYISGDAAECNIVNRNKRFYSRAVYESAIGEVEADLAEGAVLGRLGHPSRHDPSDAEDDVELHEAAIKYTKLWIRDDGDKSFLAYEGYILDTPNGRQLKTLCDAGIRIGVSTRGKAKFRKGKPAGATESCDIVDILRMRAIDAVRVPSNMSGAIDVCEHDEDDSTPNEDRMEKTLAEATLDDLTAERADLVESITNAVTEKVTNEVTTTVTESLNAEHATTLASTRDAAIALVVGAISGDATAMESVAGDEYAPLRTALEARITAERETAVTEAVAPLNTKITELETQVNEKSVSEKRGERDVVITEAVGKPEVAEFAKILETQLRTVSDDIDITESVIETETRRAKTIFESLGKPKGMGKVAPHGASQEDDKSEDASESHNADTDRQKQHRRAPVARLL